MKLTRRNTLIGLGAAAGGAGAIGGTGAFDTVQADRDFAVEVDDDASALLQLIPNDDDEYVQANEGMLEIDIGNDDDDDASGVNDEAVTTFSDLFLVANNGTEPVDVWFETGETEGVTFKDDGDDITGDEDEAETVATVEPGGVDEDEVSIDQLSDDRDDFILVSLEIDTTSDGGYTEPDDEYTITIHASANE